MKKNMMRLVSLLLAVIMLLQISVFAMDISGVTIQPQQKETTEPGEGSDPGEEPGDEEPAPVPDPASVFTDVSTDAYYYDAVNWAVTQGITNGTTETTFSPNNPCTRAQLVTFLMRLLGVEEDSVAGMDLSGYTDVKADGWYYAALSNGAYLGMINGNSATTMAPNAGITRQQAITIIGRAIGMDDGTAEDIAGFADADKVAAYAVPYVAAMYKAGIVQGNAGNLNPQQTLSRAHMATILWRLFDESGSIYTGDTLEDGCVVLVETGADEETITLSDLSVSGNLVLSCETAKEVRLENVHIGGKLVLAMADDSRVILSGCDVAAIQILSKTTVTVSDPVNPVREVSFRGADGASYSGDAEAVIMASNSRLDNGSYGTVTVTADNAAAGAGAQIGELIIDCRNGTFTLDGQAERADLWQRFTTLTGSGSVGTAVVHYEDRTIDCTVGAIDDSNMDTGLSGTTLTLSTGHNVSPTDTTACVRATVRNINTGYGGESGKRTCTIQWYVDDVLKQTNTVAISEGSVHNFNYAYTFSASMPTSSVIKAVLSYEDMPLTLMGTTTVKINNTVNLPQINGRIAPGDYSEYVKETFINGKGYRSNTGYLVWVNLYHTKVNVFQGSAGNWQLVKVFDCGIGAVNTPTPPGQWRMLYHLGNNYRWIYGSGSDKWYVDSISVYNGNYAFHSRRKGWYDNAYQVNDLNVMISHGCFRLNTEDARWLYNVPVGSTVLVY